MHEDADITKHQQYLLHTYLNRLVPGGSTVDVCHLGPAHLAQVFSVSPPVGGGTTGGFVLFPRPVSSENTLGIVREIDSKRDGTLTILPSIPAMLTETTSISYGPSLETSNTTPL